MTRINTNVSSLLAQNTLASNNVSLQTALTRLSTGLRINSGKDDPAGLIASEALRSDIVSSQKAVSNSERANQIVATADSALGQVSSLLNDIRGLVTEAANKGALSDDQIAANQLQIDSSLDAINRIAQTTSFQGRRLLDGSLNFITSGSTPTVRELKIDQANLGATGSLAVSVDISAAASQASITTSIPSASSAGSKATGSLTLASETNGAQPTINRIDFTGGGKITLTSATNADQTISNVVFVDNTSEGATLVGGTLKVYADFTAGRTDTQLAAIISANLGGSFASATGTTTAVTAAEGATETITKTQTGSAGTTGTESIDITTNASAADTRTFTIQEANGVGATPTVAFAGNGTDVVITVDDTATTALSDIRDALNYFFGIADLDLTASVGSGYTGDGDYDPAAQASDVTGALSGGANPTTSNLADDVTFELAGATGRQVFSFESGTTGSQIASAINLVSDATGVTAAFASGTLTFTSSSYGTNAFVDVSVLSEGASGTFESNLSATRALGTDVAATINGVTANASGNTLSLNTSTLSLSLTVNDGSSTDVSFNITGGGALFQLGPDVVSNQQARLGIGSVNTARLGGATGKLYELASGGAKALTADITGAANVVDEAIGNVTQLRGRLGAFQRTILDTNIASLNATISNLTDAQSKIRDADFATETANLTRAQILVQSGTAVLQIANKNPENVLALLR